MKSIRAILLAVMITAASMVLSAPAMVMAGEEAKTEEALKVAVMGTRNLYEYPLWYAAEKKLFDIPVEILSFRKARIMDAALLTGEVDVLSNVFMVVRDPKKFTIVGVTAASALYAIISGENVDTSKLNGKIIAVRSCIRGRSIASLTQSVIKHWAAGLNLQLYCG
ncbi:hypothetical protein IIA95_03980, partial [Patescibacteria group bacterium]|nr:hypothetical protein [Patescibacteria group bacterium]